MMSIMRLEFVVMAMEWMMRRSGVHSTIVIKHDLPVWLDHSLHSGNVGQRIVLMVVGRLCNRIKPHQILGVYAHYPPQPNGSA